MRQDALARQFTACVWFCGAMADAGKKELSEEEVEVLREVFAKFDADGGGSIDEEELGVAMKALGAPVSATELSALVKEIDEDGNGEIDFDECVLTPRRRCTSRRRPRTAAPNARPALPTAWQPALLPR